MCRRRSCAVAYARRFTEIPRIGGVLRDAPRVIGDVRTDGDAAEECHRIAATTPSRRAEARRIWRSAVRDRRRTGEDVLVDPALARQVMDRLPRELARLGVRVLPTGEGNQACGETGAGRLMEPEDLVLHVLAQLGPKIA